MQRNTWKKDRDLMIEAYDQHIIEEGLFNFFKNFSRKLFKSVEKEVEGVDDELIENLIERLKDGGPEAVESFLDVLKKEAGVEFEGAVKTNSNKILKALRYGVDSAVDGIANFIYHMVELAKDPNRSYDWEKGEYRTDKYDTPFTTTLKYDTETGRKLDSAEDEDTEITPQSVLDEIEEYLQSVKVNKSFGFNANATLMVADKLTELADKLRNF